MSGYSRTASLRRQITSIETLLDDLKRDLAEETAVAWAAVRKQDEEGHWQTHGAFGVSEEVSLVLPNNDECKGLVTVRTGTNHSKRWILADSLGTFGDTTETTTMILGKWYEIHDYQIFLTATREDAFMRLGTTK
jgi:hypothetical protein